MEMLYTPSQVAELTSNYVEYLSSGEKKAGLRFGSVEIDEYLMPFSSSDLIVFMARPGMGKSSALAHYVRNASSMSSAYGVKSVGVPVVVTAEMAIEDYQVRELSYHARVDSRDIRLAKVEDWSKLKKIASEIGNISPTVFMGHSLAHPERRPQMTIENIERGVEFLIDKHGVYPSVIGLDYLQRLRLAASRGDRRLDMSEIVERSKDMALRFNCPVILCVQVGRGVDERKVPVPQLADGKETGNIEETCDIALSFFRPSNTFEVGTVIPGSSMMCTKDLFFVNVLKQRGGEAGRGFWVSFDPRYSSISDVEIKRYSTEEYDD